MDAITDSVNMSLSKLRETVENREVWRAAVNGIAESDTTERLSNKITWESVLVRVLQRNLINKRWRYLSMSGSIYSIHGDLLSPIRRFLSMTGSQDCGC